MTDRLEELTAANDDICPPNCECKYCWAEREIQSLRDELRQQRLGIIRRKSRQESTP